MREDDMATALEEQIRAAAIAYRKPQQTACGICFNCEAEIAPNACYCDKDCREDHEKRERLRHA